MKLRIPRCFTVYALTAINMTPIGPPRYTRSPCGKCPIEPPRDKLIKSATVSTMKPIKKFTKVVDSGLAETTFILPLSACWKAIIIPTKIAKKIGVTLNVDELN